MRSAPAVSAGDKSQAPQPRCRGAKRQLGLGGDGNGLPKQRRAYLQSESDDDGDCAEGGNGNICEGGEEDNPEQYEDDGNAGGAVVEEDADEVQVAGAVPVTPDRFAGFRFTQRDVMLFC